jgi:hypothetical protein
MPNEMQELIEAAEVVLSVPNRNIRIDMRRRLRDAIAAARASEGGWIEIKEGCEMPKESGDLLVMQLGAHKIVWQNGEGWFDQGRCVGTAEDMGITHYQFPPSPPLPVEKEPS